MATRIIGISGYAQSGKDETAKVLVADYGFTRVAFADALRDSLYALNPLIPVPEWGLVDGNYQPNGTPIYCRLQMLVGTYGWDHLKTRLPEVRALLQRLGTEVGRDILGSNIWVDIAMRKADAIDGPVVITDLRFPNEYDAVVHSIHGEAWRVSRPGTAPVNGHPSETALDSFVFDAYVGNGGTLEDLRENLRFHVGVVGQ